MTKHQYGVQWNLRDGNQALVEPMSLDEKLEFFNKLIKVGFKEIEIGFPRQHQRQSMSFAVHLLRRI